MAQALGRAREVGNFRAQCLCYHALGAVQYLLGEWKESLAAFHRSIALAQEVKSTFAWVLGSQRLAILETRLGHYDAAHQRLLKALEQARASDSPLVQIHSMTRIYGSLAQNRLEAEDLALATRYLAEGFAAQRQVGECVPCDVLLYPAAVPIYIALGDLEQAGQVCARVEQTAASFGSRAWFASSRYLRGILAAASQERERALLLLQESLELFEGLEQPHDVARNLEQLAEVVLQGQTPAPLSPPQELLRRALTIYGRLGAAPDEARAYQKLAGLVQ